MILPSFRGHEGRGRTEGGGNVYFDENAANKSASQYATPAYVDSDGKITKGRYVDDVADVKQDENATGGNYAQNGSEENSTRKTDNDATEKKQDDGEAAKTRGNAVEKTSRDTSARNENEEAEGKAQKGESRTFKGKTYTRYPDAKKDSDKNYFRSSDGTYLHQDIWEEHNGKIPEGYVVHHKDFDSLNNDIENLEIMPVGEHISLHRRAQEKQKESAKDTSAQNENEIKKSLVELAREAWSDKNSHRRVSFVPSKKQLYNKCCGVLPEQ